jgi:hypothetical protein
MDSYDRGCEMKTSWIKVLNFKRILEKNKFRMKKT